MDGSVCIGVAVHSAPGALLETLRVLRSSTRVAATVVLLPDGPDDETAAALAGHPELAALPQHGTAEPCGLPAALNRLAQAGPADVLVLLESGALWARAGWTRSSTALHAGPATGWPGRPPNFGPGTSRRRSPTAAAPWPRWAHRRRWEPPGFGAGHPVACAALQPRRLLLRGAREVLAASAPPTRGTGGAVLGDGLNVRAVRAGFAGRSGRVAPTCTARSRACAGWARSTRCWTPGSSATRTGRPAPHRSRRAVPGALRGHACAEFAPAETGGAVRLPLVPGGRPRPPPSRSRRWSAACCRPATAWRSCCRRSAASSARTTRGPSW